MGVRRLFTQRAVEFAMNQLTQDTLRNVVDIVSSIKQDQQSILEIAEDTEKSTLREIVYDLGQAAELITRAINR